MKGFNDEVAERLKANEQSLALNSAAENFLRESTLPKYSYNFSWLDRPIIQYPQDIVLMQELIWRIDPDLIIETGIAHGGSSIFYASMLELLAIQERYQAPNRDAALRDRKVIAIDIDIRAQNRSAIESHSMARKIEMIEGSSVDPEIGARVMEIAGEYSNVLVVLDSNHTKDHVLAELSLYAPLVSKGSYCIVFDTMIETLPAHFFEDRPWGPGNNPMVAVREYLKKNEDFSIDRSFQSKGLITTCPDGFLRRIR